MIKRLHDANLHATFYYEIKKINRCLTRLISETAMSFGSLSRWGGNDDGVQGYQIN